MSFVVDGSLWAPVALGIHPAPGMGLDARALWTSRKAFEHAIQIPRRNAVYQRNLLRGAETWSPSSNGGVFESRRTGKRYEEQRTWLGMRLRDEGILRTSVASTRETGRWTMLCGYGVRDARPLDAQVLDALIALELEYEIAWTRDNAVGLFFGGKTTTFIVVDAVGPVWRFVISKLESPAPARDRVCVHARLVDGLLLTLDAAGIYHPRNDKPYRLMEAAS